MKYKIGEILSIKEDFELETMFSDELITVKKGDQGFVDSLGNLHYISGKARGKIQAIKDCAVEGYDNGNIANLIYLRLLNRFGLRDILEEYDIDLEDFMNEIEDILDDIL